MPRRKVFERITAGKTATNKVPHVTMQSRWKNIAIRAYNKVSFGTYDGRPSRADAVRRTMEGGIGRCGAAVEDPEAHVR